MKKVAIYCVTYHSYDSLFNYLSSIEVAVEKMIEKNELSVLIADNSVPSSEVNYTPKGFSIHVIKTNENKGYFGAIRLLMQTYDPVNYDYSIISNVDVLLSEGFFNQLEDFTSNSNIGWIAPAIYSTAHQFDFNPQALNRYSRYKMDALRLMFKFPWLLKLKQRFLHQYRNITECQSGPIYAGHGSFIILTKLFFERCGIINYPIFLYGEEIFLAEVCRTNALEVFYEPNIKVTDIGRVSTGNIPSRQYCRYNYLAMDYIIKTFY